MIPELSGIFSALVKAVDISERFSRDSEVLAQRDGSMAGEIRTINKSLRIFSKKHNVFDVASKNIAHFPMIISNSISAENAFIVCKAFEREVAKMFELIITNESDRIKVDNKSEFVKSLTSASAQSHMLSKLTESQKMTVYGENLNHNLIIDTYNKPDEKIKSIMESEKPKSEYDAMIKVKQQREDRINTAKPTFLYLEQGRGSAITIGIKSIYHSVDSTDLTNTMVKVLSDPSGLSLTQKLIKVYIGEMQFWKDLVFSYDSIKTRIKLKDASYAGSIFNSLIQSVENQKPGMMISASLGTVPTTTIVMSLDEQKYLKSAANLDLANPKTVERIIKKLGILTFIVIDEPTDTMYMYNSAIRKYEKRQIPREESKNKEFERMAEALGRSVRRSY